MSYATINDLIKLLPEETLIGLTDDEDLGVVNTDRVDAALETATVVIDGYLASRYSLPFSSTPPILSSICVDLAGHLLHIRRDLNSEMWEKRHENAVRFLEKIGEGKLSLGAAEPTGTGDKESLAISAPAALFGDDELERY